MNASIEQLKAEAEAAAKKLQEAEAAAREAERKAKQEAERVEREQKEAKRTEAAMSLLRPLLARLQSAGLDAKMEDRPSINISDLVYVTTRPEQRVVSTWRSVETGRMLLVVSSHYSIDSKDKRFPPTKAGYSYDKIVDEVRQRINAKILSDNREKTEATKQQRAEAFAKSVRNLAEGSAESKAKITHKITSSYFNGRHHVGSERLAPEGHVFLRVGDLTLTPEQVAIVVKALDQLKGESK